MHQFKRQKFVSSNVSDLRNAIFYENTMFIQYGQKIIGQMAATSALRVISEIIPPARSAQPFDSGVYGAVTWVITPLSRRNFLTSGEVYSRAPSN